MKGLVKEGIRSYEGLPRFPLNLPGGFLRAYFELIRQAVDLFEGVEFRDADEEAMGEVREIAAQGKAGDDLFFHQLPLHLLGGAGAFEDELVVRVGLKLEPEIFQF